MQYQMEAMDGDSDSSDRRLTRWILPALVVSLLLHLALLLWAKNFKIEHLKDATYDRIVPRTFHLERAEIDPRLLEPEKVEESRHAIAPTPVVIPDEQEALGKNTAPTLADPTIAKLDHALLEDKPTATSPATSFSETILAAQGSGTSGVIPDKNSIEEQLLRDNPGESGPLLGQFANPGQLTGNSLMQQSRTSGEAQPGFSNLDDLLAQTGPLSAETAPILMPTDLLYDYDQADLRAVALTSLNKLGELIRRNPNSRFLIEGHTDSFGSDEYNVVLSSRRAEAVKAWLVTNMAIAPERIEAKGFGKSHLIASGSGSIEEQQINRRVEIVILGQDTTSP